MALLGLSRLPLVTVGDITQKIDGPSMTVENQVGAVQGFDGVLFTSALFIC